MKHTSKLFIGTIFIFLLIVAIIPVSSRAADSRYWKGLSSPPNTLWSDSGNWDAGGVPLAGQYAIINLPNASVTYNNNYPTGGALFGIQLDNGSSLIHAGGTTLTLNGYALLGFTAGQTGTYELSNGTLLLTDISNGYGIAVGYNGTGIFNQSGGNNTVAYGISIGRNGGSSGTYTLDGGTLIVGTTGVSGSGESVGRSGTGTFIQNGGTHTVNTNLNLGGRFNDTSPNGTGTYYLNNTGILSADNQNIGQFGKGTFVQNGGSNTVATMLTLGQNSGSDGTYTLNTGTLRANGNGMCVGQSGTGTFIQKGGSNEVATTLGLGMGSTSEGTYNLSDGTLTANYETIGGSGTGTFNQSGGKNTVNTNLNLGQNSGGSGTYNLTSGTLDVKGSVMSGDGAGTFNVDGGSLTNNWSSINVKNFNVGYAAGSNGSFVMNSKNLTSNSVIIGNSGTGTFNLSGTGSLSAGGEMIGVGGTGNFKQTGGTNTIKGGLLLGTLAGSVGTYNLGNGSLSAEFEETIGVGGTGTFIQTGGSNTIANHLYLGSLTGSHGTYELGGNESRLSAGNLTIGMSGIGNFKQTGGTNDVTTSNAWISLGKNTGSHGTYELSGTGSLSTGSEMIGDFGTGIFKQTGGTNTILGFSGTTNGLTLGNNLGGIGTYELSGNESRLLTGSEMIGNGGTGIFDQTGGSNTVINSINIAGQPGSQGTYNLKGGTLTAATINNNDQFNFSGGTLNANLNNNATGTTTLSDAGTRTVNGTVNNWGIFNVTNTNAVFTGGFNNYGTYTSDPSTQKFLGDLTIGTGGSIVGGVDDVFELHENFINNSLMNMVWDTDQSDLIFATGADNSHDFWLAGADLGANSSGYGNNFAWDLMDISGNILNLYDGNSLLGGALYVHALLGAEISGTSIGNIFGNGMNIYYDPRQGGNSYLGGGRFSLGGGGFLTPIDYGQQSVPEPSTMLLLGLGLLGVMGYSRRRFRKN